MSQTQDLPPRPRNYRPGTTNNRYARFAEDWLNVTRTYVLDTILEALEEHQQVVVIGGNGVGKSYFVGVGGLSALYCNPATIVHVTAGTSSTLKNYIWKPTRGIFKDTKKRAERTIDALGTTEDTKHIAAFAQGRTLDGTREIRTGMDEEWYFECVSPKYPDDLEGAHNEHVIYFIEEADKPGVTADHIDSVRSTVTDENDRVCVVANPPTDEGNIVYDLLESEEWHTLQFASWDSHNVRVERGIEDGEKIGGLVDTSKIRSDWNEYHDEDWPGLEQAIEWSDPESEGFREDLHERWYKRRAGIVPPQSSETWRPFSVGDVEGGYKRDVGHVRHTPEALGVDVADETDETKAIGLHGPKAEVEYTGTARLPEQTTDLTEKIREWPELDGRVDAVGSGRQMAQELTDRFPGFAEYGNGEIPADDDYRTKWAHGLALVGEWLRDGGSFSDGRLYEELKVAARTVKFERNHLRSRGKVIEATSKERVKESVGRSPDSLDALLMALYARETNSSDGKSSGTFSW